MMDRCYKLSDRLSEFTEVQSILHCCKRNTDGSTSPCWGSKLLQWGKKCVCCTNTSHTCAHLARARRLTGSHSHARRHLHAQIHRLELRKTHTSKHTPEKATVNEPRSRPKRWHQSGTLSPFGSRRTVSRICLLEQVLNNSKVTETILCISACSACQTRWRSSRSSLLVLFTAIVQIVKAFALSERLFSLMMIYLHETALTRIYAAEHHLAIHLGVRAACECWPA